MAQDIDTALFALEILVNSLCAGQEISDLTNNDGELFCQVDGPDELPVDVTIGTVEAVFFGAPQSLGSLTFKSDAGTFGPVLVCAAHQREDSVYDVQGALLAACLPDV